MLAPWICERVSGFDTAMPYDSAVCNSRIKNHGVGELWTSGWRYDPSLSEHREKRMGVLAIAGLLTGGWLAVKRLVGTDLYVTFDTFALICDVCGHTPGECVFYRDRDEW